MKRKIKDSEYITYEELIKRNMHKRRLLKAGFKFIDKTNRYKKIIAYSLIAVGVITSPLPTGSIVLIGLGLGMLGIKKDFIKRKWKLYLYKRKAKGGCKE